jgi:hypothetical protein
MAAKREAVVAGGRGTTGASGPKYGRAASAGMEAMERGKEGGSEEWASGSGTSVNLHMGGLSVRREEENHMLLYIWILNGE